MKFHQLLFITLAIFTLFFTKTAFAQSGNATLRIIATTEDEGTPVIAANVLLTSTEGDTLKAGTTDAYGFLEFPNLEANTYRVRISYIGYETLVGTVTLEPGETQIYRPELATDTAELDELVVRARRSTVQREAGLQSISPEDLNRVPTPGPGGDLTMYLQTLPSVVTTGDRGGELFVRGGTPSQNLILVENMPVIKPFHISNLFSAFPQNVLSGVDVYAGGFGSKYTGATSAVVDVNIRQGNMRSFQSEAAVSPYIASFQAEGPIVPEEQSFMLMGRYSLIEDTGPTLTGEDVPLRFSDIIGRYSIKWPTIVCNMTGLHTYDSGRINPARMVDLTWSNTAIGMRCLGFAEELNNTVDFTIGYTGYNSTESGVDNVDRESSVNMGYMRMDNRGNLFGIPTDYGFKLEFIQYQAFLDDPFAQTRGRDVRFTGLSSSLDDISTILSTYVSLDWEPVNKWTIRPGIASQMNIRDVEPTIEPRLRIFWQPRGNDDLEFSFAAGRYYQMNEAINDERDAANVFYVYKPIDKDDPLPVALHGILGYRQQINPTFGLSIETYVKSQDNIPVAQWTREPANTLETGLVESFTYGADIQAEMNLNRLFVSASYGYSEVTYEAPSDELVAWIDEPVFSYNPAHDRRHQLNVIASFSLGKYTANASWQYASGGPFTQIYAFDLALTDLPRQNPLTTQGEAMTLYSRPYGGKLPSFQRLDVSLNRTFQISRGFEIETEVGAINTLNTTNVFYFDVNTLQQVDQLPLVPYLSFSASIL